MYVLVVLVTLAYADIRPQDGSLNTPTWGILLILPLLRPYREYYVPPCRSTTTNAPSLIRIRNSWVQLIESAAVPSAYMEQACESLRGECEGLLERWESVKGELVPHGFDIADDAGSSPRRDKRVQHFRNGGHGLDFQPIHPGSCSRRLV